METGCGHGPAWYVQRLAEHLARLHSELPALPLTSMLADAIRGVCHDHNDQCDLSHPGTPASTVCLVRDAGDHAAYLVLCDSPLVLDRGGEVQVVTDGRFDNAVRHLRRDALNGESALDSAEHLAWVQWASTQRQQLTNQPGGYWIAAAEPAAAYEAITGEVPLAGPDRLRRAALLTDGASAAVDRYGLLDWSSLLDVLTDHGPAELIRLVRVAENADHDGRAQPRYKRYDDATAALCLFEENQT
jgi:hypothetical protein